MVPPRAPSFTPRSFRLRRRLRAGKARLRLTAGALVRRATLGHGAAWARWPSWSSKPVRSCNPRLGRFDSGAAPLNSFRLESAVPADAAAVTEVVVAVEASFYGQSDFSEADLADEWAELDVEQSARVVRDGGRIVGYGVSHGLGKVERAEVYVHPEARGRGIGRLLATGLE